MRYWGLIVCFCLLGGGVKGQTEIAVKQLLETPGLKHAAIGIAVSRVEDGKMLVTHNAETALTPASVTKLLPTFFALQQKGKGFQYRTRIFYTGEVKDSILTGDLVVAATGDPTLESRYFPHHRLMDPVLTALEKAGIRRILGSVRVEGTKEGTDIPGSWPWEDVSNYYAALYLPFNYRDNTCVFHFQTGVTGTPARMKKIEPVLPGVKIVNEVVASVEKADRAWVFGGPYSKELYIRGTLPQNRTSFKVKGAMHHPDKVFIAELTRQLKEKGIVVENTGQQREGQTVLLTLVSPELGEIVFHTNKSSVNLFAEALGKLVFPENWPENIRILLKKSGIESGGVMLKDACGLSPMNAVPASVFTDLLVYAAQSGEKAFERSLPVAGKDGGLSGYCVGSPELREHLKAKTGSMTGVRCLAGYLTTVSGEQLAFTILINHYSCTTAELQRAVGKFLERVRKQEQMTDER